MTRNYRSCIPFPRVSVPHSVSYILFSQCIASKCWCFWVSHSFNEYIVDHCFPTLFQDIEVCPFQFTWKPLDVLEPEILNDLDDDTSADLRGKSPLEWVFVRFSSFFLICTLDLVVQSVLYYCWITLWLTVCVPCSAQIWMLTCTLMMDYRLVSNIFLFVRPPGLQKDGLRSMSTYKTRKNRND